MDPCNFSSPSSMVQSLLLLVLFYYVLWFLFDLKKTRNRKKLLPPGPPALPIIGNLHQLQGDLPHQTLAKLSEKYGQIMFIRMGSVPTVVVSSSEKAKLFLKSFLKSHDAVFACRSPTSAAAILFTRQDMLMAPYADYWRRVRKMCVTELLSSKRVESFRNLREKEVSALVEDLWCKGGHGSRAADLSDAIADMVSKIALKTIAARTYSGGDFVMSDGSLLNFKKYLHEGTLLLGRICVGDLWPFLDAFDLQGIKKQAAKLRAILDEIFDKLIQEHRDNLIDLESEDMNQYVDLVDVLLHMARLDPMNYSMNNIRSIMLAGGTSVSDMYAGAAETSSTTLEWAMSELLRNPSIMTTLKHEIEAAVAAHGGKLDETCTENMKYMHCVIKETLHLHPPIALGIPHQSTEEASVDGFNIPKSCRLIFNIWAIGRDPSVWKNAEQFKPERFMADDIVDVSGLTDMKMIPFSAGRRICPGIAMALPMLKMCIAALVFSFDWSLPDNADPSQLDMAECHGIGLIRKNHLLLLPHLKNQLLVAA